MIRRSQLSAVLFTATLLVAIPGGLRAQANSRFKVLIPDFQPTQGADKDFGKKTAEDLRGLMNGLLTHQPVPKKDIDDALKQYHLKMEELDCPKTRQLATQMKDQVALCASYQPTGKDSVVVTAAFWDTRQNESFQVTPVTAEKDNHAAAAKKIFDQFDRYTTELRAAGNCGSYEESQQYQEALGQCDKALDINPKAQKTRYRKAHILFAMKNYPAAMGQLDTLLQQDPIDEDGLQLAGYISGAMGNSDKAVDYYTRYLQLQPGNAQVRMNVAYNLASKAGDPAGAARLIQAGLDRAPDNTELLTQFGGFAFAAGQKIANAAATDSSEGGAMPPEAQQWFNKAITAYQKVFTAKGAETDADLLKTLIAAYVQIDSVSEAISTAEKALQTHPNNDDIWSYYADALHKNGQLDKALTALDRVKEINPNHANVGLRQGQWLIQAGRVTDGVAALKDVAASDPAQAQTAARLVFNSAYSKGIQGGKDYKYAAEALTAALTLPNLNSDWKAQLTFWDGYSIYQKAYADQQPQTVKTAKETLPQFQKAKELLVQDGVDAYAKSVNVDMKQMLSNVDTFIDIQQKIIQRGSGG